MISGTKTKKDSLIHNTFYISDIDDDIWSSIKNSPYISFKDYDIDMFETNFAKRMKQYARKQKINRLYE